MATIRRTDDIADDLTETLCGIIAYMIQKHGPAVIPADWAGAGDLSIRLAPDNSIIVSLPKR